MDSAESHDRRKCEQGEQLMVHAWATSASTLMNRISKVAGLPTGEAR